MTLGPPILTRSRVREEALLLPRAAWWSGMPLGLPATPLLWGRSWARGPRVPLSRRGGGISVSQVRLGFTVTCPLRGAGGSGTRRGLSGLPRLHARRAPPAPSKPKGQLHRDHLLNPVSWRWPETRGWGTNAAFPPPCPLGPRGLGERPGLRAGSSCGRLCDGLHRTQGNTVGPVSGRTRCPLGPGLFGGERLEMEAERGRGAKHRATSWG